MTAAQPALKEQVATEIAGRTARLDTATIPARPAGVWREMYLATAEAGTRPQAALAGHQARMGDPPAWLRLFPLFRSELD